MKKIIFKFLIFFLFFTFSCSEDFLEVENKNSLTDGSFYQTKKDFELALNSLYTPLAHSGMFGLQYYLVFNSFEDRMLWETEVMDRLQVNPSDTRVTTMWRELYMGVFRTNTFIEKLNGKPVIEGLDEATRMSYLGQARALRAKYMFYLVVIFNKPPYYDDMTIPADINQPLTNGNPEDFWNLIEGDLKFAQQHLSATYPAEDLGRITSGAAASLLGKAMLFKYYHFYVKNDQRAAANESLLLAKQMFETVINSGVYQLIEPKEPKNRNDYIYALLSNSSHVDLEYNGNVYPAENNAESIWEIQFSDERDGGNFYLPGWTATGSPLSKFMSVHDDSWRNLEIHPDLWDAFESEGAPEGFLKDPRAYATCYIDTDTMDFRPDSPYYKRFRSGINTQNIARNFRNLIPTQNSPYPTRSFGLKKSHFPVYYEKSAPFNDPTNRRIIRFADVLLMHAEVCLLLGETAPGQISLNKVRARVDMPEKALSRESIIHERDIELATEGHRWMDLIRWSFDPEWGIDMQTMLSRQLGPDGTGDFFFKGKHEYLPIPIREINLNRGQLIQNDGW